MCGGGGPIACTGGDFCNIPSCDPAAGCTTTPRDCTGGNVCISNACNASAESCAGTPVANGTVCGPSSVCQSGVCTATCSTFTGNVSSSAPQVIHTIGNRATGVALKGTLSCPNSTDIDLYLQVQKTTGWSTVANSLGLTCSELVNYTVSSTNGGLPFRWVVQFYSGVASSYSLQSCPL